MDFFFANRALYGHWVAQIDRSRASVGVQVERSVLRQPELNTARSGVDHPSARGFAFSFYVAASGLRLQRTADVAKLKAAGTGLGPHRPRRALLQHHVTAAGLAVEASCNPGSMNRAAAG